jgi:hypothetical protein
VTETLRIKGWLAAEAEPDEWNALGRESVGGRLFLFRTRDAWTLVRVRHSTAYGDSGEPEDGHGYVATATYPDLNALREDLWRDGRQRDWRALAQAGFRTDADLTRLWTPVQIDLDLDKASVHRRDLGVRGDLRGVAGWEAEALDLAVTRLEELGFIVLEPTTDHRRFFPRDLLEGWSGNVVVGAVVVARYGYRADLVVAVDGAGEVYTRTPDVGSDPGEPRHRPPRPLTDEEGRRVEEAYDRRRTEQLRRDFGEEARR